MNGLINLYKPSGMSSAQAVGKARRILDFKAIGHMGTLDPMAEGVLVLGVGKSTRLFDYLIDKKKTYIAKLKFGYITDTLDALGTVLQTTQDIPSDTAVLNAALSLLGETEQIPPEYSAKHINGKRAYDLARSGNAVTPKPIKVQIYDVQLISQPKEDEFVLLITCSSGTYIRAFCRDIATLCGSLATLTYLQRTQSGIFSVTDSVTFENLEVRGDAAIIPPDQIIELPSFIVPFEKSVDLDNGRAVECDLQGQFKVYCNNVLYGIGINNNGKLKIKTYLKD